MDTDDFSEMTWSIIVQAAEISDTLKAELGSMSMKCEHEDDWLQEVRVFLEEIIEAPDEYVEFWNLDEYEGVTAIIIKELAIKLNHLAAKVLTTPLSERGKREY